MYNSIARYNIVYNELTGIIVSQSHNNLIYNNKISNSGDGINVGYGSTRNKISNNSIMNSIGRLSKMQHQRIISSLIIN